MNKQRGKKWPDETDITAADLCTGDRQWHNLVFLQYFDARCTGWTSYEYYLIWRIGECNCDNLISLNVKLHRVNWIPTPANKIVINAEIELPQFSSCWIDNDKAHGERIKLCFFTRSKATAVQKYTSSEFFKFLSLSNMRGHWWLTTHNGYHHSNPHHPLIIVTIIFVTIYSHTHTKSTNCRLITVQVMKFGNKEF